MTIPITADDVVQSLTDEVERPEVVALLNQRWERTLTIMAAPGGYGKTRALAQAIRSNEDNPLGIEFYLRCRAAHADPVRFGTAMLNALGAETDRNPDEGMLIDRVLNELAAASPTNVVLIIDDVHRLSINPAAVDMLVSIVRELPTNSHMVLVGRSIPEMPLARLRADDALVEIDESDLVFSPDEVERLAERHGVDQSLLAELAGWPALVRLAVVAGKAGPQNFLMQEIVDDLAPAVLRGLTVAVLAGSADDELLSQCKVALKADELSERVPMLDLLPTGQVQPHDLWVDLLANLASETDLAELIETVARWHGEAGRYDEAIILATEHGAEAAARSVLMDALGSTDVGLRSTATGRWLELFGGAEGIADDDADLLLLRGWHGRLARGPGHGDDDVAAALRLFHERGDARGEAYASVESAFRGYLAGDVQLIGEAVQRSPRLVEAGMVFLQSLGEMTSAIVADINGDFVGALEHSLRAVGPSSRPDFVELALRHRATLQFLVGDVEAAVATTNELVAFAPNPLNRRTELVARFAAGDIDDLIDQWDELRYGDTGNRREDFVHGVQSVFVDACLGLTPNMQNVRGVTWERPRERFQQVLCEWCAGLIEGNEEQANAELASQIAELGLDNPMIAGDICRFIVSSYIAVPEARAFLEDAEATRNFGQYQVRQLGLARLLLGLRTGDRVDWSGYQNPAHTISSMSLPWSVEIACGLVLHDEARGLALADALFTYTGARPQKWLRRIADSDARVSAGAQRLLSLLPAPPGQVTVVHTQGELALVSGTESRPVNRVRVRQLLLLLALRGSVRRDVAMTMLWPDKDLDKARNNLRITLTHLRNDLEPDRRSGEPSYHLRQRGDDIVLHRSELLQVDLWRIQEELVIADQAARSGERSAQLEAMAAVADVWQPPLLRDLLDIPDVRSEIEALQAELVDATVSVAEACVSSGDWEAAERLATKLVQHDHYDERAHAALIGCHLGAERMSQAHQAIDACIAALADLGVQPAPATRMLMRRAQYRQDARRTA